MGNAVVDSEYYDWLLEQIDYFPGENDTYDDILMLLFNTIFTWTIANDDNRAEDGLQLRSIFMEDEGWNTNPFFEEDCSVLEMMIALSMRIDSDIMWDGENNRTSKWFWEMFENLGLHYLEPSDYFAALDIFLGRKYDKNGVGGLFPLRKNNTKNQKKVEIWYQAQAYLMENYEF